MKRAQIALVLGVSLGAGCGATPPPADNDMGWVQPATAVDGTGGDDMKVDGTGGDGTVVDGTGDDTSADGTGVDDTLDDGTVGDGTVGDGTVGDGTVGDGTAGEGTVDDGTVADGPGGTGAIEMIAGTAGTCTTYGLPENGMCGGIYCNVDLELLTQAFAENPAKPNGCGTVPAELACSGLTARTVAACARKIKSANPVDSNDMLRPKVRACVFEEAELQAKMPESCLECYLDAAACSSDNCLVECLPGDSTFCDQCRLDKGCSLPVADCTGFPNPF